MLSDRHAPLEGAIEAQAEFDQNFGDLLNDVRNSRTKELAANLFSIFSDGSIKVLERTSDLVYAVPMAAGDVALMMHAYGRERRYFYRLTVHEGLVRQRAQILGAEESSKLNSHWKLVVPLKVEESLWSLSQLSARIRDDPAAFNNPQKKVNAVLKCFGLDHEIPWIVDVVKKKIITLILAVITVGIIVATIWPSRQEGRRLFQTNYFEAQRLTSYDEELRVATQSARSIQLAHF